MWTGSVNHIVLDSTTDTGSDSSDSESEDDVEELEGEELLCSLQKSAEKELEQMAFSDSTKYQELQRTIGSNEWKKAESSRSLGYNGNSSRSQRRHAKAARDKEMVDAQLRKS
jgi:hypothetical protein